LRKLQRPTNDRALPKVGVLITEIAGEPDSEEQVSVVILAAAKLSRVEQLTSLRSGRYSPR
jgi:hypothetical protein